MTTTATTADDVYGPIDFILLEFPADRLTGETSLALTDLLERGVVRLYDLVVLSKDADEAVEILELTSPELVLSNLSSFRGARSGLLRDEDIAEAASVMKPGTVAALIVYENTWAIPFVAAARNSGGELVASLHIPANDVVEALDALEAFEALETVTT